MHFTRRFTPSNEKIQTKAPAVVAAAGYRLAWCDEDRKHILSISGAPFGGCWDCEARRQ